MSWIREQIDKILLSDHEWKKKYCPSIYKYLFEMTEKERKELWIENPELINEINRRYKNDTN